MEGVPTFLCEGQDPFSVSRVSPFRSDVLAPTVFCKARSTWPGRRRHLCRDYWEWALGLDTASPAQQVIGTRVA